MRRTLWFGSVFLLLLAPPGEAEPEGARALLRQASNAYANRDYRECGRLYSAAIELGVGGRGVPYNAACCVALDGDIDRAFELLDAAVDAGWRDVAHLQGDSDLQALHAEPRWTKALERVAANRASYAATVNAELLRMYEQDQADRSGQIEWAEVAPRDEQRRQRVQELLEGGAVKSSEDHFHAAMIMQHGVAPEDYKLANELALEAARLAGEHDVAAWLAAASMDRYLQSIGEPQIYGTQFRNVDGVWTLNPINESAVTDQERARSGVPPLAEAKKRVVEMNAR